MKKIPQQAGIHSALISGFVSFIILLVLIYHYKIVICIVGVWTFKKVKIYFCLCTKTYREGIFSHIDHHLDFDILGIFLVGF